MFGLLSILTHKRTGHTTYGQFVTHTHTHMRTHTHAVKVLKVRWEEPERLSKTAQDIF